MHRRPAFIVSMNWFFGAVEELLPLAAFLFVQQKYGFQAGIVVMTALVIALLVVSRIFGRSAPRFAVASTVALLVFSVPSIISGDNTYFQVSDTIVNGMFALILLVGWASGIFVLKFLFDRVFAITDEAWRILSLRWGILLAVLAALNEYVRLGYPEDIWVAYKAISTVGILLFGCYQFRLSAKMRIKDESNWLGLRT